MAHDGGMGDACGGGAHQHFHVGIVLPDQLHQALLHLGTDGGGGEGQAVVAVDGALDAAGPGEGLVRPQEHRADAQQIVGDFTF